MSQRIDRSWIVFISIENAEHDRCVDFFGRPDETFGFEEFRRDMEDGGRWTPLQYFSGVSYVSATAALETAERCIPWLAGVLDGRPDLRARIVASVGR
jgi:hypothetical protein